MIMNNIKRAFSSSFKAKVALDLIKETDTMAQLCAKHGIHPTQAGIWKAHAITGLPTLFDTKPDARRVEQTVLIDDLYRQIGKLNVELDWLKKKTDTS